MTPQELAEACAAAMWREDRITSILEGWPDEMGREGGIAWVAQRLLDAGIAVRKAPGPGGQA